MVARQCDLYSHRFGRRCGETTHNGVRVRVCVCRGGALLTHSLLLFSAVMNLLQCTQNLLQVFLWVSLLICMCKCVGYQSVYRLHKCLHKTAIPICCDCFFFFILGHESGLVCVDPCARHRVPGKNLVKMSGCCVKRTHWARINCLVPTRPHYGPQWWSSSTVRQPRMPACVSSMLLVHVFGLSLHYDWRILSCN